MDKNSKKLRNIKTKHSVYFDVDDVVWPYKGVRGKGIARKLADEKKTVALVEKILTKYVKSRDHPIFTGHLNGAKKGGYAVIEITPKYFSTWDYGKLESRFTDAALK